MRHLFALPRGRGPSQTPKFLSPGPPSPWLPALPIERRSYRFRGEPRTPLCAGHLLGRFCQCRRRFNARGAGGGSPRRNKVEVSPFPLGRGGGGIGAKNLLYGRKNRRGRTQPPRREPQRQVEPVPRGFSPGDARGEAPCMKITLVSPFPLGRGGRGIGAKNLLYDMKNRRGRTQPPAGNHNGRSSRCRAGARPPCPPPGTPSFFATAPRQ